MNEPPLLTTTSKPTIPHAPTIPHGGPTIPHAPYPPAPVMPLQPRHRTDRTAPSPAPAPPAGSGILSGSGGGAGGGYGGGGGGGYRSQSLHTGFGSHHEDGSGGGSGQLRQQQRSSRVAASVSAAAAAGSSLSSTSHHSGDNGGVGRGSGRSGGGRHLPSRIAFVPGAPRSDLYGAINCSPVGATNNSDASVGTLKESASNGSFGSKEKAATGAGGGGGTTTTISSRLKYGPPLLEIRRLKYSLYSLGDRPGVNGGEDYNPSSADNDQSEENRGETMLSRGLMPNNSREAMDYETNDREERAEKRSTRDASSSGLFHHETILVSRGIPGLGGSVSSTCLDFRPQQQQQQRQKSFDCAVRCATGLTSGALCIHTLSNLYSYDRDGGEPPSSAVAHFAPRQQRPATSVAWRPGPGGGESNLVAVGLVGSGGGGIHPQTSGAAGAGPGGGMSKMSGMPSSSSSRHLGAAPSPSRASVVVGGALGGRGVGAGSAGVLGLGAGAAAGLGGDRDFGALVWDIEAQSSVATGAGTTGGTTSQRLGKAKQAGTAAVPIKTPAYRFAHNSGVESLSWLYPDGQVLAVGCQKRNVQLYDLRVSGTNAPPVSVFAHTEAVAGIVPDRNCQGGTVFATFGRNAGEPVKIWDARMMDSTVGEIVTQYSYGGGGFSGVSDVAWSIARPGVLSIAVGDSIRDYDTRSPGSRSLPVGVSYADDGGVDGPSFVRCVAFQPQSFDEGAGPNPFEFYPHRTLAVSSQGQMKVIPECHAAPLAVSKRDGRIATGLGGTVWIGPTTDGPSAMEGKSILTEEISARMMRRARCFHASRYSTDARDNVRMLEEEKEKILAQEHLHLRSRQDKSQPSQSEEFSFVISNIEQLLHCWRWIALVEHLSINPRRGSGDNEMLLSENDLTVWPAKGLIDAGVIKLLRMSSRDFADESNNWMDTKSASDTLFCDVFDSPMRRAALNACGWIKKYGNLHDLLDECEGRGEFERSAALAVWHGDLNGCVSALQRGAEDVRALRVEDEEYDGPSSAKGSFRGRSTSNNCESYAETLGLIAMCVAGFNVTAASDGTMRTTNLWSSACSNLLRHPSIAAKMDSSSSQVQLLGVSYLRAILLFLQNIGSESGFNQTIYNEGLSLADRVGFACRFLPRTDLHSFLDVSMRKCIKFGRLEGLIITGLDKRGIGILQSYIDRNSDVQTAALISCRVILPMEWTFERRMCLEWLESYRLFLNNLQMWNSRAAFDVGRFEHLRRLKQGGNVTLASSGRQFAVAKKQHQKDRTQTNNNNPPQLWARCNYCNASLPLSKLRRQEGIANSWLSRQKPVLTCCPQCKKPLPRCSICLLSLGCLNPYMELQRERNQYPRSGMPMLGSGGGGNIQGVEDLSGLASVPFGTWFAWCMRCKHGGHAHHLCGWFEKHSTCAVSGCDCQCQFDGIEKLSRPGLQQSM